MNIVILNGSPNRDGNTSFLCSAFKKGAEESGHNVTEYNVANMNIHGCTGCRYCRTEGNGKCIQRDDMDIVNENLNSAELVVLASPIYFWSITGQLQSVITRFYPHRKPIKATKYALILSAESGMAFDAAITQYNDIIAYSGIENMGILKSYGYNQKSDSNFRKAYNFGKSI